MKTNVKPNFTAGQKVMVRDEGDTEWFRGTVTGVDYVRDAEGKGWWVIVDCNALYPQKFFRPKNVKLVKKAK